ncbi:hypothetical protein [Mycobacteroides abscessus]|uniref:Uncharacterized protein n=1 Tax=Mycobacteroides abscessus TaxID=36809 RepID=A0A0U0ZSM3_9MYCO|nr:hypothetical protein [Mycobacteroides abscessus]CPV66114.1 Uncharacterised protein [Mycobacteroides abscessus]
MTTTTRGDLVASFLAHGARRGWQISICDRGTYPYPSALVERAAEAGRYTTDLADQAAQITQVWALMNSRLDERARIGHDHPRFPAAVLVIDDLDSLLGALPSPPQPSAPTAVGTGRLWQAASLARNTIPALRHRTPPCPPQWRPEPGNTRDHLDALRRRGRDVQIYLIIANPAQPSGLRTFTTFDYRSGPTQAADSKTCAVSTNRAAVAAGGRR